MTHAIALAPADYNKMPPAVQAGITFLAAQTNPRTHELYRRYLHQWLNWCQDQGLDPLADIRRAHLEMWIAEFRQTHKDSTLGAAFSPIRGYYKAAHQEELIDRDPTAYIKLPKVVYPKKPPVDLYDARRFLELAKAMSPRHWCLTQLACVCGLRISEACSLDVEDGLNIEQGMKVLHFIGKGGKPAEVPVPMTAMLAIDAQIGGRTTGPLLTELDGSRLTRHAGWTLVNTINLQMDRLYGIKIKLSPHYLRKIGITEVCDAGGIEKGRVFARHEDGNTTERVYRLSKANHAAHPVHLASSRLAV